MKDKIKENYQSLFLENIKWLRAHYSITEKEMSEKLGIGKRTLKIIESGEFPERLSVSVLFRIEKHFGVQARKMVGERLDDNRHN